jgi:SAM-dependent methyltransferase
MLAATPAGRRTVPHAHDLPFDETHEGFFQGERQWVHDHFVGAPEKFRDFVSFRQLEGKRLLDVGCGDGLLSYGLLTLPLSEVVGLDIIPESMKHFDDLPRRITAAGLTPPTDTGRFSHFDYDGVDFPFPDSSFDIVFSWGAFEHISDPLSVLREMRRVLRPDGFVFVTVFPWYFSRYGSHLTDFIDEPWFQLKWTHEQVRERLEQRSYDSDQQRAFVFDSLVPEYERLNGFSADMFYDAAREAGMRAAKVDLLSVVDDLTKAPDDYRLSDLMITGSTMMLVPRI